LLTAFTSFAPLRMIPLSSSVAPDHKPTDVLEKNDRQIRLITIHHKARCFVRAIGINNAAHLNSLLFGPDLDALWLATIPTAVR